MKKLLLISMALLPLILPARSFDLEADDDGKSAPATPAPTAAQPQQPAPATDGSIFADDASKTVSAEQRPVTAPEPAPVVTATGEKKEEPTEEKKEERPLYFSIAAKADMTAPMAQVDPGFGAHLDIRYILPWVNPWLSVGVDAAWYRLSGKGTQTDPQIGLYDYSWVIDTVPINIGVAVEIDEPLKWLVFIVGAGGSVVWARSEGDLFGGNSFAEDFAYGYYAHAGLEFRFLPFGGVTIEYRHTGYFLDFNYPELNEKVGDIGGAMVLVGYKYTY